uniref:Uncharacterized protein n=1 Tax=Oryza barthii TaxID=65489 RepID=A0A0D3GQK7_9ORYZ
MAITPVDSPSPPSPISRANLHFSRLLALPADSTSVWKKCQEIKIGGSHLAQVLLFTLQSLNNEVSLYNEKFAVNEFWSNHSISQMFSDIAKVSKVSGSQLTMADLVVLQFAKDDDIGFGGSHSAQVLLSRDRKLTPVQCKVIAAMHRNPVHI